MKAKRTRSESLKPSEIVPGNWRGELLGGSTLNLGQMVQDGPPRQSIEFTYLITPAIFTAPETSFKWPGITMTMTPSPMRGSAPDAGRLFRTEQLLSLTLTLEVTRGQFSDMLRLMMENRLKEFHFTIDSEADGSWPVRSWGMLCRI